MVAMGEKVGQSLAAVRGRGAVGLILNKLRGFESVIIGCARGLGCIVSGLGCWIGGWSLDGVTALAYEVPFRVCGGVRGKPSIVVGVGEDRCGSDGADRHREDGADNVLTCEDKRV